MPYSTCETPVCNDCADGEYQAGYTSEAKCLRQPNCDPSEFTFHDRFNQSVNSSGQWRNIGYASVCSLLLYHISADAIIKQKIFLWFSFLSTFCFFPFSSEQTSIWSHQSKARQNTFLVCVFLAITAPSHNVIHVWETQNANRARELAKMVSMLHTASYNRAVLNHRIY